MDPDRIPESFPAPSFRGHQRAALSDVRDAFAAGNDVVVVRAPTGSGKSLLARAIAAAARRPDEADPARPVGAYYTTPQVSQLDDVAADPLLDDFAVVRGKGNYTCILPGETTTPVDRAPCARESGYDCSVRHRCPYYADRAAAAHAPIAATTLAYFMRTAGSDVFGRRDVVVVDEAHGLAEWAEMYATVDLRPETVPVWDEVGVPDVTDADDPLDRTARFAETLADVCERARADLAGDDLSPAEAARRNRLAERRAELRWFVADHRDPESPTTWVVDQPDGSGTPIAIKPLDPGRYLRHTVWDRGSRFALLSATILDVEAFCRRVGLDPADAAVVDVPHTFPLENRPLYDVTRGKMTRDHRDETLPAVARLLVRLMAHHPDEKGLVHCHSYAIQERLADRLADFGVGPRVRTHGRADRDRALADWTDDATPTVFLSVKMEEALDLGGDLARWQVLCKAPYASPADSRVARRLDDGRWGWYYRVALRTVVQAAGRVVRSPEDHGATYLADSSLLDLFERASADVPDWFAAQVERCSTPDLPPFDPEAALSGLASATGRDPGRGPASGRDRNRGDGRHRASGTDDAPNDPDDHPLTDVWGE